MRCGSDTWKQLLRGDAGRARGAAIAGLGLFTCLSK